MPEGRMRGTDIQVQADGRHRFSHIKNVLVLPHPVPQPVHGEVIFREPILMRLAKRARRTVQLVDGLIAK